MAETTTLAFVARTRHDQGMRCSFRDSLPALVALAAMACGGSDGLRLRAPNAAPPRRDGAVMLVQPGKSPEGPIVIVGSPSDVVRGRVRWHVDADGGATRARDVTRNVTHTALSLPTWLGSGIALVSDDGLSIATPGLALHPIVAGALANPTVGGRELWARTRPGNDWVRIDLARGHATFESPPLAAPIVPAGMLRKLPALAGRSMAAGPEYVSPQNAFAIVDLLGPVVTHDGGDTWAPLDRDAVSTAFGSGSPTRVIRGDHGVLLANDEYLVPTSGSGQLGVAQPMPKTPELAPDSTTVHLETVSIHGVPLADGTVLVTDDDASGSARFSLVTFDPVRVLRVTRARDLSHCELRAPRSGSSLAIASCRRNDESPLSAGGQVVVGTVSDGASGLHLTVEKVFPFSTGARFSASGALVVASSCSGSGEGGVDLLSAAKTCVRDAAGSWHDVAIVGVGNRRATIARSDGGVVVVRDEAKGTEIITLPPGALPATKIEPLRLDLKDGSGVVPAHELLAADEIAASRLVVWRRFGTKLTSTIVELGDPVSRVTTLSTSREIAENTLLGIVGDRALMVTLEKTKPQPVNVKRSLTGPDREAVVALSMTTDSGAHWKDASWPDDAPVFDLTSASRRVECGALGCRLLGWTRLGWYSAVLSHDSVIDVSAATPLPPVPAAPKAATRLVGKCAPHVPSQTFDVKRVPRSKPYLYASAPSDVLLGAPEPKLPAGQAFQVGVFNAGAVRGGVLSWGPQTGSWGDLSRIVVHFASDLDPIGTSCETLPIAAPFATREAARASGYVRAFPLAPGRVLISLCDYSSCGNVYRAIAGAPLERVDLSSIGEVMMITNARELGGSLLLVGTTLPRKGEASRKPMERMPFAALVTASGVVNSPLPRPESTDELVTSATLDAARNRFGLQITSALPTWRGGTTFVLPLDGSARPSGGFEILTTGKSDIARPHDSCNVATSAWDRAEISRSLGLSLDVIGLGVLTDVGDATVRGRLTEGHECLDRLTLVGERGAFQWEPKTKRATLLRIDSPASAVRHDLTCTVDWE